MMKTSRGSVPILSFPPVPAFNTLLFLLNAFVITYVDLESQLSLYQFWFITLVFTVRFGLNPEWPTARLIETFSLLEFILAKAFIRFF